MSTWKGICPGCDVPLEFEPGPGGRLLCPICATPLEPGSPTGPTPNPVPVSDPKSRHLRSGILALGMVFFVAAGGLVAAVLLRQERETRQTANAPVANAPGSPNASGSETVPVTAAKPPVANAPGSVPAVDPEPVPQVPHTLAQQVNRAIDRGVVYLRDHLGQAPKNANYLALAGLALLESGVKPSDPVIDWIAADLRFVNHQSLQNYQLSLAILFFDRLGRPQDEALIRRLGTMLVNRQYENGTWSYRAAPPPRKEPQPSELFRRFQMMNPRFNRPMPMPPWPRLERSGDHSNTQFAALALWVAGRHGAVVHEALMRTDAHFRKIQNQDGSWGYRPSMTTHHDSMTCAALMSLAIGHAIYQKYPVLRDDPSLPKRQVIMSRGFYVLAQTLDRPQPAFRKRLVEADSMGDLYFLWSLERMAMIYHLKAIGKREWYPWAARMLVDSQQEDGSWQDAFPGPVDTSFALLILKRSNWARDLTHLIQTSVARKSLILYPGLLEMDPAPEEPRTGPARESRQDLRHPLIRKDR